MAEPKAGSYELLAHSWQEILSKPGEPFDFVMHHQGDTVELNKADARRFLRDGLVKDPNAPEGSTPGAGESRPPGDDDVPDTADGEGIPAAAAAAPRRTRGGTA